MFSTTSRYHGIETAKYITLDGRQIVYLQRRFLPIAQPTVLAMHTVNESDRLDNITAHYLGDPEQFWHLCDANNAMHPNDLTDQIGRLINIPLI
jgi:hypothetical protein